MADVQNDYDEREIMQQHSNIDINDEVQNNPKLHSEEQDESEIPNENFLRSIEQENTKVLNHVGMYRMHLFGWISFFTNSLTKFAIFHGPNGEINFSSKPKYVRQYYKDSLKRLEIDCIDLYSQTSYDSQYTIEDTVGALAERVKEKLNILVFLNVPQKFHIKLILLPQFK
ncbi:hypothetical protein RhiirA4_427999 [Rhizophagus irregularis]|uniref:NADP-dependent oxidoreductase domain-containing protein n=1 Tax=Rhizophagus irregularis TaxID=588596 RepID=A0A2I1HB24_9GLOM|nr:hypothetical protein RhiirA4_427999 [Rhizophagus irregularis]